MEKAQRFQDLIVWQKSHEWVLSVYAVTKEFPEEERYGLTSQLRRSAVSVPSNIAEAFKRRSDADTARLLNIAQASLAEATYQLILANDLDYCDCTLHLAAADEVARILESYRSAVLRNS